MRVNKKIVEAIKDYYFNRYRQYDIEFNNDIKCYIANVRRDFNWNKEKDLKKISKAVMKNGFIRFEACAGTFVLSYKTKKTGETKIIYTDISLFPKFCNWIE